MEYVKPDPMPDPIVDPSKIKEHNDKYLESLQSGFGGSGSSMGPPTPMGMGPPTPMTMDLVSTRWYRDSPVSAVFGSPANCTIGKTAIIEY